MGFFDKLLNPQPKDIKNIVTKINAYFVDINPELARPLQDEAIFYAEKESNFSKIKKGLDEDKDAEYFALLFIYLGTKDLIQRGHFHIYSGIASAEGGAACNIACDCLDRLTKLGHFDSSKVESMKSDLKEMLTDIGIG
jgi:hypothetical protein